MSAKSSCTSPPLRHPALLTPSHQWLVIPHSCPTRKKLPHSRVLSVFHCVGSPVGCCPLLSFFHSFILHTLVLTFLSARERSHWGTKSRALGGVFSQPLCPISHPPWFLSEGYLFLSCASPDAFVWNERRMAEKFPGFYSRPFHRFIYFFLFLKNRTTQNQPNKLTKVILLPSGVAIACA